MWQAQKNKRTLSHTQHNPNARHRTDDENAGPMALSDEARQWLTNNGLEGFLCIANAPPHDEPEQAAATIDLFEIVKRNMRKQI